MRVMNLFSRAALCCGFAAAVLLSTAWPAGAAVLLNEVLADPARDWDGSGATSSRDDEWVEIVNTGPGAVDLTGFRLAGADTTWRFEFSGTLAPGEVRVVFGGESYAWEQATGNPAYGLRLGNTGGEVALWRLSPEDTVMVDCHAYADHEAEDDRSSGRVPDGAAGWALFDGLNPYAGPETPAGSGCTPTPGATVSCPTPVEPATWGNVKRRLGEEGR